MEEDIKDELEKIYNDNIKIDVEKRDDIIIINLFIMKKKENKRIIISFITITYKYLKNFTIDYNILNIVKKIDYNILKIFKEE